MEYERKISENQQLTFTCFDKSCLNMYPDLNPDDEEKRMLYMIDSSGLYTGLAFLLSDQCTFGTSVCVYKGRKKSYVTERMIFTGSVISQLDSAYRFIDKRGYPEDAVKEILANSIIHRDYSFSANNIVNIYEDRIEAVSLGGLPKGISIEAVMLGVSQPANPLLMEVFRYAGMAEGFGTGISRIKDAYDEDCEKPLFESAEGAFRVTLPKIKDYRENIFCKEDGPEYLEGVHDIKNQKEAVCALARLKGRITRKDVEKLLGIRSTRAYNIIKELCDDDKLSQIVNGRSSYYIFL